MSNSIYSHPDEQYLNIMCEVMAYGIMQGNRTIYEAQFIPSAMVKWDLRNGMPVLTTKHLFFKQSIGEILGFIRGFTSAKDFRDFGCRFWDSDANENKAWLYSPYRKGVDDTGAVYGATWRNRNVILKAKSIEEAKFLTSYGYTMDDSVMGSNYYTKDVDQLAECVDKIINNPTDRRIIMHAWFPELFPMMCLPPCHVMYIFVPDVSNKVLHMTMVQRSCDLLLGVPMNIFGSALLLELIAKATGYTAGVLSHQMTNVHLYTNQFEQAGVQLGRTPLPLPQISIRRPTPGYIITETAIEWLESVTPDDIEIINYRHHPALERVEMAQDK